MKKVSGRRTCRSLNRIERQTGSAESGGLAWLGKLDKAGRLGVLRAAEEAKQSAPPDDKHGCQQLLNHQLQFEFDDSPTPQPR
jgi:hypothetical protein